MVFWFIDIWITKYNFENNQCIHLFDIKPGHKILCNGILIVFQTSVSF